jgi:spore photoproduct lyase
MKRHRPEGLDIAKNTDEILTEINNHSQFTTNIEKPNQTHSVYLTYDISCNEDFALHAKYHEWEKIFTFFRDHPKAMASFATKYVNKNLLSFNSNEKVRIRFSLMPQDYSSLLEPNTSTIEQRLEAIRLFKDAGYDVHLNFSPVIVKEDWLQQYEDLFNKVLDYAVKNGWDNDSVKAEVIFLTHNKNKHEYNLANNISGEDLIWKPEIQEDKISQYGGENIRYKREYKYKYIRLWLDLHNKILPWNNIRYIF